MFLKFLKTLVLLSLPEAVILLLEIFDPNWVNFDHFMCQIDPYSGSKIDPECWIKYIDPGVWVNGSFPFCEVGKFCIYLYYGRKSDNQLILLIIIFLRVIQMYTKFAKFARLYFLQFTTFHNQTSQF